MSRGRMPLNKYRTDRFLFIKGQLVYSYDYNKIAFTNCIGKVTRTIDIGNYQFHHDFRYDKKHDKIICLVNNLDKDTIEDTIVQVDVKTGKTSMLFDCEKILPLMRKLAIQRKGGRNTYGGTELDWIHINSFDFLDDGNSLVLSSREQSSILKIKNIYTKPELDYVIHRGTIYNGTDIAKYQLKREGDFVANAGQHMITVEYDDSLPEGQYYLYMFNNNYGKATSIPTFDWSMYPNVGNFKSGTSYYSKFLVDEKTRTYKLAQQFSLPYSAIVSSVQHLGGNIPFSSGMSKIFGEYDKLYNEMVRRLEEGDNIFKFYHFNIDLNGGPCVYKRIAGCGAGHEYIAVTPDGEIYPCHQFVGNTDFLLGNIYDGEIRKDLSTEFKQAHIYNKPKCKECWARFYCSGGCQANNFNFNGDIHVPYEVGCEMQKKRIECAIALKSKTMDAE